MLGYTERRTFLDKKYRDRKGLPAPKSGYRSKNSVINDTNKVYDHMATVIWGDWKKEFPDKPFPCDLPQVVDDVDEQVDVKAAETEDPPKTNNRSSATIRPVLLQKFLKRRIIISVATGVVILISGLVYALDRVSATDANLSALFDKSPDLVNGKPVANACPPTLSPTQSGHGNPVHVVLSQKINDTTCWTPILAPIPADSTIRYLITYENNSAQAQNSVVVGMKLPVGQTLIPNSTYLF